MKTEESRKQSREHIHKHLTEIKSAQDIFDLFKILGYPENVLFDVSAKRKKSSFDFNKEDDQKITEIYSILSFEDVVTQKRDKLPVFLLEVSTISNKSLIRNITKAFDDAGYFPCVLIFTVDYSKIVFVFPDREKIETGKHKLKLTKLVVEKTDIVSKKEYYSVIETLANLKYDSESNWREIWKKWKKAFSVERVTENFFEDYKEIFFTLRNEFHKQKVPRKESHEFTLQFLNRIMFIYFVSKKNWLERQKFVEWLWNSYKTLGRFSSDEFYEKWLKQVFLKAFNNRSNEIEDLPDVIIRGLSSSPYLNGGLFRESELDSLNIKISDKMFQRVFEFFEKYNFTIKEDMPLESEVAVDPQMIGYVYESLANIAEEIYDRNDLGIFYTPKIEVDFMCRRSLVEYLSKNMTDIPKEKFYHLVFDLPEDKEKIEKWFVEQKLLAKLEETLDNLSVMDPACGSGAFLVGMLNVVSEMYRFIYKNMGRNLTDFQLKNRVIQYSLYGVDVMPWAIHAAELRLWLQLIVETEFKKEELRRNPLLPNLNLNLRIGDSLVQEIGGISFNVRTNGLKSHLKRKLENLKQEKRKYFENSLTARFKTPEEIKGEEILLFEEIINERIESLQSDIEALKNDMKRSGKQTTLFGETNDATIEKDKQKREEKEAVIEKYHEEIEKLKKIKQHLKDPERKPFVWDIDFAEIFSDKNGFDIVIGNPPYVRQEMISPPNKLKSEVSTEDKKEYKDKLLRSVRTQFPIVEKVDKQSDYYVYFYFHGMSLLNKKGTFCFITSTSWLDVEYGLELQEFLCKYVPIIAIYDNPKRSFAHADINTVIALFGAPEANTRIIEWLSGVEIGIENQWPCLNNVAKFVMFKKPFEEVLSSANLIDIESISIKTAGQSIADYVKNVVETQDYRVFPILQEDLLDDGWEYPEGKRSSRFSTGNYGGNKWGAKYLRASELLIDLFRKNCITLIPKNYGKVITAGWSREGKNKEAIYKISGTKRGALVLKSPKDTAKIDIQAKDTKYYILPQKFKNKPLYAPILLDDLRGDKHLCRKIHKEIFFSHSFHGILPYNIGDVSLICGMLNSSLTWFLIENLGRRGLGGGAIRLTTNDVKRVPLIIRRELLSERAIKEIQMAFETLAKREILDAFSEMGLDNSRSIRDQEPKPLQDRLEIDNIIFNAVGLTKEERKEVYWTTCELVKLRRDKARSLDT